MELAKWGNGFLQILVTKWIALTPVVCTLHLHECVDSKLLLDPVTGRYIEQTASTATSVRSCLFYLVYLDNVLLVYL